MSGSRQGSGSGCTSCCSLLCERRARSNGRGRSTTLAMCRRNRGLRTGPSPVDRARNGSKHHLLVDATGIPLAWTVTGGNRHDSTQLIPLVDRVPPVRGKVGRPRRRPNASAPTAAPTTTAIVASSVGAGSHRRSRGASPATARGSAATAGSLSAPSPGCTSSTRRFSRSAAASSATADSRAPHCETSSKPVVGSFGGASTSGASCSATATLRLCAPAATCAGDRRA